MLQEVPHEDTFVVSSSTALGMGEYLLALLNTVVQNLPESELRKMRDALDQSLTLADDLLISISLSSPFDTLALDNGTCPLPSVSGRPFYFLISNSFHRSWRRRLREHQYELQYPSQSRL